MNIDELQAGPELDQLVAEHVMGWSKIEDNNGSLYIGADGIVNGWAFSEWRDSPDDDVDFPDFAGLCRCVFVERWLPLGVFRPSVDWAAAGLVFEKMIEHRLEIGVTQAWGNPGGWGWEACYCATIALLNGDGPFIRVECRTAPLAICRAALKAVLGVDKT